MTGNESDNMYGRRAKLVQSAALVTGGSRPLLGIGDFSRFTGLSVRMLRHYDERGLLVPVEVDPFTGPNAEQRDRIVGVAEGLGLE